MMGYAVLPNTRLKLTAPVRDGGACHSKTRYASILFVDSTAWRGSLSAIR